MVVVVALVIVAFLVRIWYAVVSWTSWGGDQVTVKGQRSNGGINKVAEEKGTEMSLVIQWKWEGEIGLRKESLGDKSRLKPERRAFLLLRIGKECLLFFHFRQRENTDREGWGPWGRIVDYENLWIPSFFGFRVM